MTTLQAHHYSGKKADAATLSAWWDARIACEARKGGLAASRVLLLDPPEGGLDSDFDAEEFLKRELGGNPPGTVLAVPFTATAHVATGAETRGYAAMKKAIDRAAAIETKGYAALTGAKSKTVGCKRCESKIARAFLKSIWCPVCDVSLLPKGTQDRYATLQDEIAGLTATILAERKKAKLKPGTYVLVASRFPEDFFPDPGHFLKAEADQRAASELAGCLDEPDESPDGDADEKNPDESEHDR